jgi:hypothetical protein
MAGAKFDLVVAVQPGIAFGHGTAGAHGGVVCQRGAGRQE